MIEELKKLNCEIENGDNKSNRYEDFISLKNKINVIIRELNKTNGDLRNKIIDVFKDNKDEEFSKGEIFDRIRLNHYTEEDFEKELIKLLEEGFIFEAKPSKFRWLG